VAGDKAAAAPAMPTPLRKSRRATVISGLSSDIGSSPILAFSGCHHKAISGDIHWNYNKPGAGSPEDDGIAGEAHGEDAPDQGLLNSMVEQWRCASGEVRRERAFEGSRSPTRRPVAIVRACQAQRIIGGKVFRSLGREMVITANLAGNSPRALTEAKRLAGRWAKW
jgi:hypothetical protein